MKLRAIKDLLQANYDLLSVLKGHNLTTIKTSIMILEAFDNQELLVEVRDNVITVINTGDIAEIYVGRELGFIDKTAVSITQNDLPTKYKNEIKLCYSNNRPSNTITDKGHYMLYTFNNRPQIVYTSQKIVRACRNEMVKKLRGGKTYAKATIEYIKTNEPKRLTHSYCN